MNNINAVPSVAPITEQKTYIECPKCGDVAEVDTSMILTSYPPQYQWSCPHCSATGYIHCGEVESINPVVFKKTGARFATHCKICGDKILIYGDENPEVCKNCKEAVLAMRRALGI